ncbi:MAG: hypothetical protein ACT4PV_10305 [Planctomycetaceae bacterium]
MSNSGRKSTAPQPTKLNLARLEKSQGAVEMQGDRLVVRISRNQNPELYDIDRLIRSIRLLIDTHATTRHMRDLTTFLEETERSLQIILRNHLELAMRKYLGQRPV